MGPDGNKECACDREQWAADQKGVVWKMVSNGVAKDSFS